MQGNLCVNEGASVVNHINMLEVTSAIKESDLIFSLQFHISKLARLSRELEVEKREVRNLVIDIENRGLRIPRSAVLDLRNI